MTTKPPFPLHLLSTNFTARKRGGIAKATMGRFWIASTSPAVCPLAFFDSVARARLVLGRRKDSFPLRQRTERGEAMEGNNGGKANLSCSSASCGLDGQCQ
ncbi:unnamed protein product [Linum trigynum]|uniref:Uncharacterized protein n=1 Tax=Linum trigynum TaxID=586398 RepID=A0AAV2GAX2_9ROSI